MWKDDPNTRMVDVGLATSAAPTYFPVHQIGNEYYTDGGVWCNNPAIAGFTEAMRFFYNQEFDFDGRRIKYTSIQILSISSVNQPNGWSTKRKKDSPAYRWLLGNKLLQPFMEGQSFFTDYFMNTLARSNDSSGINMTYKRVTHAPLSKDKMNNVDLDKATPSAIADLLALGKDEAGHLRSSRKHEINGFFTTLKSFKN
jgi:patatin-like phospholipase/acyl hydrolase